MLLQLISSYLILAAFAVSPDPDLKKTLRISTKTKSQEEACESNLVLIQDIRWIRSIQKQLLEAFSLEGIFAVIVCDSRFWKKL